MTHVFAFLLWCSSAMAFDFGFLGPMIGFEGGGINCAQLDSAAKLGFMGTQECTFVRSFRVKETCCGTAAPPVSPPVAAQGQGMGKMMK
jgi:hypothetical protein